MPVQSKKGRQSILPVFCFEIENEGYAHEQRNVNGRLFVDAIDFGSVATQFFSQPDRSFSLPFYFFKNSITDMHSEMVFVALSPKRVKNSQK